MRIHAFVLLEFLMAVVILGVISVAATKLSLSSKKQEFLSYQQAQSSLQLINALLQISRYLEDATKIITTASSMHFYQKEHFVQVELRGEDLYLDDVLLLSFVRRLEISRTKEGLWMELCDRYLCIGHAILLYGEQT
ncbi:periplasmic protein [Helicobacter mustelae]|uniref:Putative periplasmic protein n=1 Tax=Helicobacter mustelae (strain ATCC 43772 / CCUG 25715 / CIP 103759 / LMG 18044 / NCTC 12198 / R85-136P) TaxID=679897 RepID=D3UIR3_HELM1|nr:periplasmic protein [Helicobacter mustelae]CBG40388.1 Putative periplasmic protein [Helicobacter mustelae 12198]SQH71887.1 periplasmic protein [Helicobacter mustelae]